MCLREIIAKLEKELKLTFFQMRNDNERTPKVVRNEHTPEVVRNSPDAVCSPNVVRTPDAVRNSPEAVCTPKAVHSDNEVAHNIDADEEEDEASHTYLDLHVTDH